MKELHDFKHSKEYGYKGSITLLFVDRGKENICATYLGYFEKVIGWLRTKKFRDS
jgi:hypothetical protein